MDDNQEHEELLLQYQMMRDEILNNDKIALQQLGATILIVGAAMGFALNNVKSDIERIIIFVSGAVISSVGMQQSFHRIESTFLIASYLRNFVEPKTKNLKWELRLFEYRKKNNKQRYKRFDSLLTTYLLMVIGNSIFAVAYMFLAYRRLENDPLMINDHKLYSFSMVHIAWLLSIISLLLTGISMRIYKTEYQKFIDDRQTTFDVSWKAADHALQNSPVVDAPMASSLNLGLAQENPNDSPNTIGQ